MKIQKLIKIYACSPQVLALVKTLKDVSLRDISLQGLVASAIPTLFAALAEHLHKTILFVLQNADEAGYFYNDLTQMMGNQSVLFFPSSYRRQVKYAQHDAANEILRTEVLARLSSLSSVGVGDRGLYVVTYPEALSEKVVTRNNLNNRSIKLNTGDECDISELTQKFRHLGFKEVDYVYEPGQFAQRGSLVDVYSFSHEYPFRLDFFGDEIDSIRTFEVQTQLSMEKRNTVEVVPELNTTEKEKEPFLAFLPQESLLFMKDFKYISDRIERIYREGFSAQAITERMEGATEMEQYAIREELKAERQLLSASEFKTLSANFRQIRLMKKESERPQVVLNFNISPQPLFHKNFDLLVPTLEDYKLKGYKLYILADNPKQQQRLKEIFASEQYKELHIEFTPVDKTVHEGFTDNDMQICLFTDHQIFDRFHKYDLRSDVARSGKMALTMKELREMEIGDYVVHVDYGIGKFAGLVRLPIPATPNHPAGGYQEVIRIVYSHNDKVDVSIHSLYKISKYKRKDSEAPPRLSTLGTGAWDRLKERAKKKIKDIARDLIKLYAARLHEKGFSFSADSFMQHELEASFLYEDTPDQLKATQDVKADMERARPMDRLICGDVGFGKTEVAVRAAFKAAYDGKQVAVLVPTTVLAYQHYQTFCARLKDMPVRVAYLSRACSIAKTRQILADLASGKIDIIIGTHKLIGKGVKFHDLGLLIIDEEQKFGVTTKEKLRTIKTNVDTLTMTATPIPRTLQFSLMGARDMSIIQTPPPNRYPINTEIHTFNGDIIADAINFEMSRNGQIFFVNNRISNLPEIAALIHKRVPDARVAIGHGQMKPEELEKIVMGFINYDYDVLLSTTIVENGVDIPNANTIIINDAQRFGLADLHQMRGRVGRGNKKAFCYLLAPPLADLNQDARRRLEALETFSELGSGFSLSMQDLDIRGAGNLFGAEQSGFVEDLGYETYQKILSQAVTELKNDEFSDMFEEQMNAGELVSGEDFVDDCSVESDLEMYMPELYVPGSSERIILYRELDSLKNDQELQQFRKQLIDRFGPIPHETEELMQVVPLRRLGRKLGCEKILLKQGQMILHFVSNPLSAYYKSHAFDSLLNYITNNPRRCNLREIRGKRSMIVKNVDSVIEAVNILRTIQSM